MVRRIRYLKTTKHVVISRHGTEDWERYLDTRLGGKPRSIWDTEFYVPKNDWPAIEAEIKELFGTEFAYIRGGYWKSYRKIWRKRNVTKEA